MIGGHLYKAFLDELICHREVEDPSSIRAMGAGVRMGRLPPAEEQLRMFAVWIRARHPAEAEAVLTSLWEEINEIAAQLSHGPVEATPPPWSASV